MAVRERRLGREPRVPRPFVFYANPNPPVEFFARGLNVDVAWLGGETINATGNSFATPHVAGICALVLSKHPELTPFQLKSVLHLTATNVGGAMSDLRAAVAAGVFGADEAFRSLLQSTVETARAIFHAKASSVFLLDEETDELVFEAVAGEGADTLVGSASRRAPASPAGCS